MSAVNSTNLAKRSKREPVANMIGKIYSGWEVIGVGRAPSRRDVKRWNRSVKCRCVDCGSTRDIVYLAIKQNKYAICPCQQEKLSRILPPDSVLISGFPDYCVDRSGNVWSRRLYGSRYRSIGPWWKVRPTVRNNRLYTTLYRDDKSLKQMFVHRLVLEAFIGPCPEGMECCHWDGNPQNNEVSNLRWDTHSSNVADMVRHGTKLQGEKISWSKVTDKQVIEIRQRVAAGEKQKDVAKEFGISPQNVNGIVHRRQQKHLT